MTCDELELLLPDGAEAEDAEAHLAGCAQCRETAVLLGLVAQPALTPNERAKLVGLPSAVQGQWQRKQRRFSAVKRLSGLALAACVGAVLAGGLVWKLNGAQPQPLVQPRLEPEVLVLMDDSSPSTSDDESSFEVSWPSLNDDGDVL